MSPRLRTLVKSLAGLGCLVLCFVALEQPLSAFAFGAFDLSWFGLGLVCSVPAHLAQALRWRTTSTRLGLTLGARQALGEVYLAALLNLVLPSGYAGEAVRVARHGLTLPEQRGRALRAVVYERGAGQVVFWCLIAAFVPSWFALLGTRVPSVSALALVVLLVLCAVTLLAVRMFTRLKRIAPYVAEVRGAVLARGAWLVMLATSLTTISACLGMYYCTLRALGIELAPLALLRVGPLVLAAMMVPASLFGFGPREVASSVLFPAIGLDATSGVSVSLAYGALMILGALPGALVWFRR